MADGPTPSIDGHTELIVHLGFPTQGFRSRRIYNPYFASQGIPAVVVPMPFKLAVVSPLDEVSPAVQVAGACNAVRRSSDGRLVR